MPIFGKFSSGSDARSPVLGRLTFRTAVQLVESPGVSRPVKKPITHETWVVCMRMQFADAKQPVRIVIVS